MTKKIAIISGGGGYVGSAIIEALQSAHWDTATLSRHGEKAGHSYIGSVTDERDVSTMVTELAAEYGAIDACIHAAAEPISSSSLLDQTIEEFSSPIQTAAQGAFVLAKHVIPHMREGAPFIALTSKLALPQAALLPTGSYVTAKYALHGFLRSLASDQKAKGVRTYAIAPGFLPGGMNKNLPKTLVDFFARKSGVGKAEVRDVAELIVTLCVEPKSYPAGSLISIPPIENQPL